MHGHDTMSAGNTTDKKRWKWIEPTIGIVSLGTYYRHLLTMDCPNLKAVPRYHCAYYMLWSHANTHGFGIPPSINCFPASNGAGFPTTLETWNSYAFRMPAIKWASSYACQLAAEACMVLTLKLGIEKSKMSVRFPGFVGGLVILRHPKQIEKAAKKKEVKDATNRAFETRPGRALPQLRWGESGQVFEKWTK